MTRYLREPKERTWKCAKCGEEVPATMEICWNCGTSQDGIPDPSFVKAEVLEAQDAADRQRAAEEAALGDADSGDTDDPDAAPARRAAEPPAGPRCPKCGSAKIIPDARIVSWTEYGNTDLKVVVYRNPNALVWKEGLNGPMTADICGECGHVEIRVSNGPELYEHYRRSLDQDR